MKLKKSFKNKEISSFILRIFIYITSYFSPRTFSLYSKSFCIFLYSFCML